MALLGRVLETLFVSIRRFGVLLCVVVIDVAKSQIREANIRLQTNRFLVRLDCFSVAIEVSVCVTEFVLCFGVVGAVTESRASDC